MKLRLIRKWFTDNSTIGVLLLDGKHLCFTLEDVVRRDPNPCTPWNEAKVPGKTAIPCGLFPIYWYDSPKHGPDTLELQCVPGFSHAQIHIGNFPKDTEGCILVGLTKGCDSIGMSRDALALLKRIARASSGPMSIEIVEEVVLDERTESTQTEKA